MSLYTPPSEKEEDVNIVEFETVKGLTIIIRPSQIQFLLKSHEGFGVTVYDNNKEVSYVNEETFDKLKRLMK